MADLDESLLAAATAEAEKSEGKEAVVETTDALMDEEPAEEEASSEGAVEAAAGDEENESEPEKPSKKSAADTIRALKAERNAERAERDKLIAERATYAAKLEAFEQQQRAGVSAAERRAEEDRLAMLDPVERQAYEANTRAQNLEHRLNTMHFEMQDNTDRAIFQSKADHDPLIAKFRDQVETMLNEDRKKGFSASREEYLNILVGREVRKDAAAKLSAKKASAGKRIDAATSKTPSGRGDVGGSRKGTSEEDRLRGVLI